jgi:hypothetical protein
MKNCYIIYPSYDFYKIGFRVDSAEVLMACDTDGLQYLADWDNNGKVDTIKYSLSGTNELEHTTNPRDMVLYRTVNKGTPMVIATVVDFELSYRDTAGVLISPSSELVKKEVRESIRGIDVYFYLESNDPIDGYYQGTEWKRNLALKNIY